MVARWTKPPGRASPFLMTNKPNRSTPPVPDYKTADLSAWGFEPGSDKDKYGVLYSKARRTLFNAREVKGRYEIAPTVTKISVNAFYGAKLHTLIIPPGVKIIPRYMCVACSKLEHIEIPNSVTEIGCAAFHGCDSLTHIDIPASVTLIHNSAFLRCYAIKEVIIPNGCVVGKYAFPETCKVMNPKEALKWRAQQAIEKYGNPELETVGMARQGNA